jgi:uncharacterized SAM-binding protein YcdF (DUF218 family)
MLWIWFALAVVLCGGGVALWKSGKWLVQEDRFDKVHWAVVLAGESRDCERSDATIRMYRDSRIDTIVLSACRVFKNRYNSEFMVDYFVQQGVPRDRVFEFRQDAYSTLEEARLLVRQFRMQNLDTVLIITSSYHTARTRRTFRKLAQGYPVVLVASADYAVYDPNAWWSNRESLKIWFDEWARTIFSYYELAKSPAENGKSEFQGLTPDVWASRPQEHPDASRQPAFDSAVTPVSADTLPTTPVADTANALPKEPSGAAETKAENKSAGDSLHASRSDAKAEKSDSLKARKDSVKVAEAKAEVKSESKAEAKAAAERIAESRSSEAKSSKESESKSAEAKKASAKTEKKTSEPAAKKASQASKPVAKAAEKKSEKSKSKKKD